MKLITMMMKAFIEKIVLVVIHFVTAPVSNVISSLCDCVTG